MKARRARQLEHFTIIDNDTRNAFFFSKKNAAAKLFLHRDRRLGIASFYFYKLRRVDHEQRETHESFWGVSFAGFVSKAEVC